MQKTILELIIISLLFNSCNGQTDNSILSKPTFIENIKTANQVYDLILKTDSTFKGFKINEDLKFTNSYSGINYQKIADSLKVKPWTKSDFDNNGLTDILIIGNRQEHCVICILDKGSNYELKRITRRSFQDYTFPVVVNNTIKYYFDSYRDKDNLDNVIPLNQITLIYKYGDFIEENDKTATHKIEKIEYSTGPCFGSCPIFNLTINADRTSTFFAQMYNKIGKKEMKGNFHTTISQDKYNELISLLNYIDFATLKDKYAVNWTDDQGSTLIITYDNGKTKSIYDYGLLGTYGLDRVYQILFELRKNQKWTK